jgi:hypothetical protein
MINVPITLMTKLNLSLFFLTNENISKSKSFTDFTVGPTVNVHKIVVMVFGVVVRVELI